MSSPVVSFPTFGLQGPAGLIDPLLYPKAMQIGSQVGAQQGTVAGNILGGLREGVKDGVSIVGSIAQTQQTLAQTANLPTPDQARDLTDAEIRERNARAGYYDAQSGAKSSPGTQAAQQNKANTALDTQVLSQVASLASAGFKDQLATYAASPEAVQSAMRNPDVAAQMTAAMQGAGLVDYQSFNNISGINANHQKNTANLKLQELNTSARTAGVEGLQKDYSSALVDLTPFVGQRENYASVGIAGGDGVVVDNGNISFKPNAKSNIPTEGGKAYFYDKNTNKILGEVPVSSTGDFNDWQKKVQTVQRYQASSVPMLYNGLEKPGSGTTGTAFEGISSDPQKQAVDAAIDADRAGIKLSAESQAQIDALPDGPQRLVAQSAAKRITAIQQAPSPVKAQITAVNTNPVLQNQPKEWKALAMVESGGNDFATSETGVKGLFQISQSTFSGLQKKYPSELSGASRTDPYASLTAAKLLMGDLMGTFKDNDASLAAYNAGPGVITKAQQLAGSKDFSVYSREQYLSQAIRDSSDPYYQSISNDPEALRKKVNEIQLYPTRYYAALNYF